VTAIRLSCVMGGRPDAMLLAPLFRALERAPSFAPHLITTGDERTAQELAEIGLPTAGHALGVTAEPQTTAIARILVACEQVFRAESPTYVLVVGDRSAALAGALAAVKLRIPVAHVEAGLRSPRAVDPEERHRRLTDHLAAWLFTPSPDAEQHLLAEGCPAARIHPVGNLRFEALRELRPAIARSRVLETLALAPRAYAVLILDRPATAPQPAELAATLGALAAMPRELPLVFPVDPAIRPQLRVDHAGIRIVDALGEVDRLRLIEQARCVLTDAGAAQEESTMLQVPCLTLSDQTARAITVSEGTNLVVGRDPERIAAEIRKILRGEGKSGGPPATWDGPAAERILAVLAAGAPAWDLDEALSEP